MKKRYIPKGFKAAFLHGGLPEVISPYMLELIEKTGGKDGPLGRQFIVRLEQERKSYKKELNDPLLEDKFEVAPGLIYKYRGKIKRTGEVIYHGRALWVISMFCATYCRFCTRGREVGKPFAPNKPYLSDSDLQETFNYLEKHTEINEVILSGGDPLVTPQGYLTKIIKGLVQLQISNHLDIIRIGTRVPITNPRLLKNWHFDLVKQIRNPYLMVHINHPTELTGETIEAINRFRQETYAIVMSQTVLLKGVNDSKDILLKLFNKQVANGIIPYYVYQNDPVWWAAHFTVPIKKAIKLWQKLRPELSGIAANARFVIDTPFGFGKIPVPEGSAWKTDYHYFYDFKGKKQKLS